MRKKLLFGIIGILFVATAFNSLNNYGKDYTIGNISKRKETEITSQSKQPKNLEEISVMTYNIGGVRANVKGISSLITEKKPDLIGLQEVQKNKLEKLLSYLKNNNLDYNYYLTFTYGLSFSDKMDGGNCVLFDNKFKFLDYKEYILPNKKTPLDNITRFWISNRKLSFLTLQIGNEKIKFYNTHLHHRRIGIRKIQAEKIASLINSNNLFFLVGDFNSEVGNKSIESITSKLFLYGDDSDTWPNRRIDFIFSNKELPLKEYEVIDSNYSDHKPIFAKFSLEN